MRCTQGNVVRVNTQPTIMCEDDAQRNPSVYPTTGVVTLIVQVTMSCSHPQAGCRARVHSRVILPKVPFHTNLERVHPWISKVKTADVATQLHSHQPT